MAQPDQHRRARRRGLVAAHQLLAGLDHREGLAGVDAQRLEHLGGEDLAHRAFQRQPPVGGAAPRRRPEPLVPRSSSRPCAIAQLGEQEPAPVADLGVVHPELMAVIAQRERLRQVAGQRLEAPEMARSIARRVRLVQPDRGGPAIVAEAQARAREIGRRDRIGQPVGRAQDLRIGAVASGLRFGAHRAIVGAPGARGTSGRWQIVAACLHDRRLDERRRAEACTIATIPGARGPPAAAVPARPDPQRPRFRAAWPSASPANGG